MAELAPADVPTLNTDEALSDDETLSYSIWAGLGHA